MPSRATTASIYVLAGVNGAGKSSIGEEAFSKEGSVVFNPDTVAQKIRDLHPSITLQLANAHACEIGRALFEEAIQTGKDYLFETALGGNTMVQLLQQAAVAGHEVNVWFCGLESPELHIERVTRRVASGGHDIPEERIRERWTRSRENLIRLLPGIHHLRVYDNSKEADPRAGERPRPVLLLEVKRTKIVATADFAEVPEWAQPIMAAALRVQAGRR